MNREQSYARAASLAAEIEAELKAIGCWSEEQLPEEAFDFRQAFAMDTMAFSQWLQFVLLPRVHQIIAERDEFPTHSMVGVQAMREFDGDARADRLVSLLNEFDGLFNGQAGCEVTLTSSDLQSFMNAHAIQGEILRLDAPTPTVETAAQAAGVRLEQIVKSVLFLVEDIPGADPYQPVLAIACGTAYVEQRAIAAHFAVGRKRVKLASPDQVCSMTGYEVGALPPFGHCQPLPTLLDRRVLDLPVVYAGGGADNALVRLDPQEILRVTGATVIDLTAVPKP
jgi:prolyl-tRNA editing enzyme YbaK/EbsC (Cys-tRNA(Pro) deacylase)/uncharacterized protein YqcC (DUF446 family)